MLGPLEICSSRFSCIQDMLSAAAAGPARIVAVLLGWDGRVSDLVLWPRLLQAADRTPFSTQSAGSCAN